MKKSDAGQNGFQVETGQAVNLWACASKRECGRTGPEHKAKPNLATQRATSRKRSPDLVNNKKALTLSAAVATPLLATTAKSRHHRQQPVDQRNLPRPDDLV
jgi:hypothetical protein